MPPSMPTPSMRLDLESLTQEAFATFGVVIENPNAIASSLRRIIPGSPPPLDAVLANQGTALKYQNVTWMNSFYRFAPSGHTGNPVVNMFVCSPRELRPDLLPFTSHTTTREETEGIFDIKILERHPFTPQTFIPIGIASEDPDTQYLVIVVPTMEPSQESEKILSQYPEPQHERLHFLRKLVSSTQSKGRPQMQTLQGPGLPDLEKTRAFLAHGGQAVTYGAGTWHAPMVVLGAKSIDFLVMQHANGVDLEDCQEVELERGMSVAIPRAIGATKDAEALRAILARNEERRRSLRLLMYMKSGKHKL
ncbi:MAG: Ureidoglycolate lyase [Pycnora praestabilis]|nr:MAG: Ureidoglycolate lyase [Pycnora praestabilis]